MGREGEEKIARMSKEDRQMFAAIDAARKSLPQFFEAFAAPKPNQKHFLLKAAFIDQDAIEHIWLSDLDLKSTPPTGVVANEPSIQSVVYKQRVPFEASEITDWMFYEDGCLVGGYTTRVMQAWSRAN